MISPLFRAVPAIPVCSLCFPMTHCPAVLVFDLDNFVGRATAPKDEVIMAKKEDEADEPQREDAKSYYYPPDEEEPQEIHDIEARFQEAVEINRKIFGTPVFQHESGFRGLNPESGGNVWDMMIPARSLDITHTVDEDKVDGLLQEIMEDPPVLPRSAETEPDKSIVVDSKGEEV